MEAGSYVIVIQSKKNKNILDFKIYPVRRFNSVTHLNYAVGANINKKC